MTTNQTTWHGQQAWTLESEFVRTVIVPDLGAKIVSLFDKRTQREWLVGTSGRPLQKVPYGASFVEQDMSGWDEMFPTIVACDYPAPGKHLGIPLPDHGEVWTLPWTIEPGQLDSLRLTVTGKALPYRLSRTFTFSGANNLRMHYELVNLANERMPFMWAAHPQFASGDEAQIVLPSQVTEVCNTIPEEWGWGEPEKRFDWPEALSVEGHSVQIDSAGPSSKNQARKFFVLPDTSVEWAGLIRRPENDWLRFDWDSSQVPFLGLWIDEGRISHESVVALEPMTGFYDSLSVAWEKKRVAIIEPNETKSWTLSVSLGTADQSFPDDDRP